MICPIDPFEDLLNFFMVVGSPALAAYSLQITHLNASWIKNATSNLKYPNSRAITTVISALQYKPIQGWSIPLILCCVLVMFTALLEIIDSFYNPPSDGIGYSTVTVWTFLLPLVVGFLRVYSKPRPDHLREYLENANMIVRGGADHGDGPVRASDTTVSMIQAIGFTGIGETDLPRMDELRTIPVFNYARAFIWSQQAHYILSLVRTTSTNEELWIPPDGDDPGEDAERVINNNWSIKNKNRLGPEEQGRQSRWAPGIWRRVGSAMVFALGLQWGTIGAGMVINYRVPPVGLDCRTLSFLVYGATATFSMLLCVASSILAHISRPQNNPVSRPPWLQACLNGGAAVCGYLGRALAFIAGIWIVVICFFRSSGCTSIVSVLLQPWMGIMAWCCLGSILELFFLSSFGVCVALVVRGFTR